MRFNRFVVVCGMIAILGACGGEEEGETSGETGDHSLPGDPVAGAEVYAANCVACHDAHGTGNGGLTGANFVGDPTRLAKTNEQLLTSIRDGVTTGATPMPAHAELLTDEQMHDALAYIRHEFGGTQE